MRPSDITVSALFGVCVALDLSFVVSCVSVLCFFTFEFFGVDFSLDWRLICLLFFDFSIPLGFFINALVSVIYELSFVENRGSLFLFVEGCVWMNPVELSLFFLLI